MGLFGEVNERLGVFGGLYGFEVVDDLLDQGEGSEEAYFEFLMVVDSIFLWGYKTAL